MMTHQAVIHYIDGSTGSTDVEICGLNEPFVTVSVRSQQTWMENQKAITSEIIRANRDGFLTNYGKDLRDGWQKVAVNFVRCVQIGRYTYWPPRTIHETDRSDMIDQLERDFA